MDKAADLRGGASTSAGLMKPVRSLAARLVAPRSTPTSAFWWIKSLAGRVGFLPRGLEVEAVDEGDDLKPEIDTGFLSRLGLIKARSL